VYVVSRKKAAQPAGPTVSMSAMKSANSSAGSVFFGAPAAPPVARPPAGTYSAYPPMGMGSMPSMGMGAPMGMAPMGMGMGMGVGMPAYGMNPYGMAAVQPMASALLPTKQPAAAQVNSASVFF
jgi:hypothetical protein